MGPLGVCWDGFICVRFSTSSVDSPRSALSDAGAIYRSEGRRDGLRCAGGVICEVGEMEGLREGFRNVCESCLGIGSGGSIEVLLSVASFLAGCRDEDSGEESESWRSLFPTRRGALLYFISKPMTEGRRPTFPITPRASSLFWNIEGLRAGSMGFSVPPSCGISCG